MVTVYIGLHLIGLLWATLAPYCGAAQTIQKARVKAGKLADVLTPAQVGMILKAWAEEKGYAWLGGNAIRAYKNGYSVRLTVLSNGEIDAEASYASDAEALAKELAEALALAGRHALAGQVAAALAAYGSIQSGDVEIDNESGVRRKATVVRLNVR